MIDKNIYEIEQRIQRACAQAGRKREEVALIAVSKTKPAGMVFQAYQEGILDFGENKVQELCEKYELFKEKDPAVRWHMIGHLQRNKVKSVIDKAVLIHSVDSFRLAEQIHLEALKKNLAVPILIEVNIAEEESKYGVSAAGAERLIFQISALSGIRVQGLMTIAPYTEKGEENRVYFEKMRELCVDIKNKNIDNVTMGVLSMGMTNDYEAAVLEGATHIRVGTGIFGERMGQENIYGGIF